MNSEQKTDYRRRLLVEYREVVLKRDRAVNYLESNCVEKAETDKELKNRELLNKQIEILTEYEEILYCRLMLELTTN